MKDNTDEQIKNIVRELFENIFAGADDYGNPAINANLSFEEIEEQLTQSLQKYEEKVRENEQNRIIDYIKKLGIYEYVLGVNPWGYLTAWKFKEFEKNSKQLTPLTDEYNVMDFPVLIKNCRTRLGETGTDFGKRFGVSHTAVSDWENGKTEAGYGVINFVLSH